MPRIRIATTVSLIVFVQLSIISTKADEQECLSAITNLCQISMSRNSHSMYGTIPRSECVEKWQSIVAQGKVAIDHEFATNASQTDGRGPYETSLYGAPAYAEIISKTRQIFYKCADKTNPVEKPNCSAPPSFTSSVEVEDGGTASDPVYAGVSYCMAYVSSRSAYPLDCRLRGRHKTLFPGHEKELFEGWPLGPGEQCEASVVCQKETRFPLLLKQYCP
jgi:hypothetical protein